MVEPVNKIVKGKPKWLRRSLPVGPEYEKIRKLLSKKELTTVCREAKCPNQFECYSKGTATFMILGDKCTRNCGFCAVQHGPDDLPDPEEAARVAEAVEQLKLRYVVITSVTRDDLEDGGASLFAKTISAVRQRCPKALIEVLIPDLQGDVASLQKILKAAPDVLNHNIETVAGLYKKVRPQAKYQRSLSVLSNAKKLQPGVITKSGIMVGLGETQDELMATCNDLLEAGCDILTIGQYLQPSAAHLEVVRYIPPEEFALFQEKALSLGFKGVASAPFVRSSYKAEKLFRRARRAG